jgi:2'-5' RNA ligase
VAALISGCAQKAPAKWLPPLKLHLTLQYLGHPQPATLEALQPRLEALAKGRAPFSLSLADAGLFETRRAPAVLWLGVKGELEALSTLQAAVAAAAGIKQEHPFVPHLTLARSSTPASLNTVAQSLKTFSTPPFLISGLTLYESKDAVYRAVSTVRFS